MVGNMSSQVQTNSTPALATTDNATNELRSFYASADAARGSGAGDPSSGINSEQDSLGGGNSNVVMDILRQSSHPKIAVAHIVFKAAGIVGYIFGGWLPSSFVTVFVVCSICLAVDFWIVKNVSGRILVGLRWWSDSSIGTGSVWRFETIGDSVAVNVIDYRVFWYSQYIHFAVWALFGIIDIITFRFMWLMLTLAALAMIGTNIQAYWKCSQEARTHLQGFVRDNVFNAMPSFSNSFRSWQGDNHMDNVPVATVV